MVLQELKEIAKTIDPNTHLRTLLRANRLLILKFYTQTCSPCKILKVKFEEMEKQGLLDETTVLNIDAREYPRLVESYQVKSVPAVFIIKDGEVVCDAVGIDKVNQMLTTFFNQN